MIYIWVHICVYICVHIPRRIHSDVNSDVILFNRIHICVYIWVHIQLTPEFTSESTAVSTSECTSESIIPRMWADVQSHRERYMTLQQVSTCFRKQFLHKSKERFSLNRKRNVEKFGRSACCGVSRNQDPVKCWMGCFASLWMQERVLYLSNYLNAHRI